MLRLVGVILAGVTSFGAADTSAQAWLTAEEESNRRTAMRAIIGSSLGLRVPSGLERLVVTLSGSVAWLSDALHNLGDVFTTVGVSVGMGWTWPAGSRR